MKKIVIVLFLFSLIIGNVFSEDTTTDIDNRLVKSEAYLSMGTISAVGLFGGLFFPISESIEDDSEEIEKKAFEAYSVMLGYNAFLLNTFGAGCFVNYERFNQLDLLSIQAKLTLQYGPRRFKFYHAVSGGVLFIPGVAISPIFDATVLGIKLVIDDLNIFAEVALPSTGFLKIGASYYY